MTDSVSEIEKTRHTSWFEYSLNGVLHREDGPAIEWDNGSKEWYLNGRRHREDGPAIEWSMGCKEWYINGARHREDGPARISLNESNSWYRNGHLHRIDGPAIERVNGLHGWYIQGCQFTKEEFDEELSKNPWPQTQKDIHPKDVRLTVISNNKIIFYGNLSESGLELLGTRPLEDRDKIYEHLGKTLDRCGPLYRECLEWHPWDSIPPKASLEEEKEELERSLLKNSVWSDYQWYEN